MEDNTLGSARRVPVEFLVKYPTALDNVVRDISRSLVDKIVCELENGEKVCSMSAPEQRQEIELNSIEIRRTVNIKKLVRCGKCKYWSGPVDEVDGKLYGSCQRPITAIKHSSFVSSIWYCADGEEVVQK